jgi:hypothetical protein
LSAEDPLTVVDLIQRRNMTADSIPGNRPGVHERHDSTVECGVSITADKVHVVVKEPVDVAARERYDFGPMRCIQRVPRPTTFDCEMLGGLSASRTNALVDCNSFSHKDYSAEGHVGEAAAAVGSVQQHKR